MKIVVVMVATKIIELFPPKLMLAMAGPGHKPAMPQPIPNIEAPNISLASASPREGS